jgi:predicted transcriptional regulator
LKLRVKREKEIRGLHVLSNPIRRNIFRELSKTPCRTASSVAKEMGMEPKRIEWHMEKLYRSGYLGKSIRGKRVYYPSGLVREEDVELFESLNIKSIKYIIRSLLTNCRDMNSLIKNLSHATAYRAVKKLNNLGLVEIYKGRGSVVCVSPKFFQLREDYDEIGMNFKKEIIKRLEKGGYTAEIVGTYGYEVIVRVLGHEDFTLSFFTSPLRTMLGVVE